MLRDHRPWLIIIIPGARTATKCPMSIASKRVKIRTHSSACKRFSALFIQMRFKFSSNSSGMRYSSGVISGGLLHMHMIQLATNNKWEGDKKIKVWETEILSLNETKLPVDFHIPFKGVRFVSSVTIYYGLQFIYDGFSFLPRKKNNPPPPTDQEKCTNHQSQIDRLSTML